MAKRPFVVVMAGLSLVISCAIVGRSAEEEIPQKKLFGRPEDFKQGKHPMCAVWYEEGEWFLRVTSSGKQDFVGEVNVVGDKILGEFEGLEEKKKEKKRSDALVPHKNRKGFKFRFATNGHTDGVRFKVGKKAKTITFKLLIGGDDDPKKILIGATGAHPPKATFTLPAHPEK